MTLTHCAVCRLPHPSERLRQLGRGMICDSCRHQASARETLKRLPVIDAVPGLDELFDG